MGSVIPMAATAVPFYYNWFRISLNLAGWRSGPEKFLGRQFDPDFPLRGESVFLPIKHSPVELSSV